MLDIQSRPNALVSLFFVVVKVRCIFFQARGGLVCWFIVENKEAGATAKNTSLSTSTAHWKKCCTRPQMKTV